MEVVNTHIAFLANDICPSACQGSQSLCHRCSMKQEKRKRQQYDTEKPSSMKKHKHFWWGLGPLVYNFLTSRPWGRSDIYLWHVFAFFGIWNCPWDFCLIFLFFGDFFSMFFQQGSLVGCLCVWTVCKDLKLPRIFHNSSAFLKRSWI